MTEIERIIVDFFEANGASVDLDQDEYYLDGLSLVDSDVSLTALAIALSQQLTSQEGKTS